METWRETVERDAKTRRRGRGAGAEGSEPEAGMRPIHVPRPRRLNVSMMLQDGPSEDGVHETPRATGDPPMRRRRGVMAPCVTPGETGDQREASEDGVHENRQANKEASGEWLMPPGLMPLGDDLRMSAMSDAVRGGS